MGGRGAGRGGGGRGAGAPAIGGVRRLTDWPDTLTVGGQDWEKEYLSGGRGTALSYSPGNGPTGVMVYGSNTPSVQAMQAIKQVAQRAKRTQSWLDVDLYSLGLD